MKAVYRVTSAAILVFAGSAIQAGAQDQDALLKRGEYLMNGPVACGNCHNTRAEDMSFVPGMAFAGGFHIVDKGIDAYAANITQDPDTGIGTWTDEEIITDFYNWHEEKKKFDRKQVVEMLAWMRENLLTVKDLGIWRI